MMLLKVKNCGCTGWNGWVWGRVAGKDNDVCDKEGLAEMEGFFTHYGFN
jgi:hypothetical protein